CARWGYVLFDYW
nr:immunoglobulin heavy chain junction region [Mus musculus]